MLDSGKALTGLLALLLAGCATAPRRDAANVSDPGNYSEIPATVTPAPVLAPPPSAAPQVAQPALQAKPASPNPRDFAGNWIPLNRWCRASDLPEPKLMEASPQPVYALDASGGRFLVRVRSDIGNWEGVEVRMGYAPQLIDNQPYVHVMDLKKTIVPLLEGLPVIQGQGPRTIVIDPAHGGPDSGTLSVLGGYPEKDYALDWALRLRTLLVASGWRVILTRSRDVEVSISDRVALAERLRADLFVSLHFNSAAPNQTEAGFETYCLTPAGLPSNLTRGYSDDLKQAFPNNAYDRENLYLAVRVHRELVQATGGVDRGVRRARFLGVLRGQQRPAILVEGGYLSNPQEARQIATAEHRQKLAEAVARALIGETTQLTSGPGGATYGTGAETLPQEAGAR